MKIKSLQVGPIGTNCYLLCDEEKKVCAVIDPGGEAGRVRDAIVETGCTPDSILLTHGHYDHTTGVAGLLAFYSDLPVYISPKEPLGQPLFPALPENVKSYGEGDAVSVGDLKVTVLATPGHSPGSVTLLVERALFVGDTLFAGSCGRTDLPGGDYDAMMASLRRLGSLEGNFEVYPGHMEPTDLACERGTNFYLLEAMGN